MDKIYLERNQMCPSKCPKKCPSKGKHTFLSSCCLVAKSCPTVYNPMDCSTPGFLVHHQFLEFAQPHVHWVGDVIQLSYPLSPPLLLSSIFPRVKIFSNESALLIRWPKVLEFQLLYQSLQWTPRADLLKDGLVGSHCNPRDSQESSPTSQFKSINSLVLNLLYSSTLTSIPDYWKNHSFE